jgi:hypothetical protein
MTIDLQNAQLLAVTVIFALFAGAELLLGHFFPHSASAEDNRLDVAVGLTFPIISGTVFAASKALCAWVMPERRDAWADWPWWQMVIVLLLADDLTQYWWHRLSHTSVMWPLHRAHHSAAYMSVRVVYRNNAFYYALMPGLWFSGALLYLGFGWVFVGYSVVKLTVILGGAMGPVAVCMASAAPAGVAAGAHDLHAGHALRPSRPHAGRRHRPLQGQLRQSAVLLGRALRYGAHHAAVSAGLRAQRRPSARRRALVPPAVVPGLPFTSGRDGARIREAHTDRLSREPRQQRRGPRVGARHTQSTRACRHCLRRHHGRRGDEPFHLRARERDLPCRAVALSLRSLGGADAAGGESPTISGRRTWRR